YDSSGNFLGSWQVGSGSKPNGIVFYNGSLYIVTFGDGKLWQYERNGGLVNQFSPAFATNSHQMAVDACGRLHLVASANDLISSFRVSGAPLGTSGTTGSGPGQFSAPEGIAVAQNGEVYVADRGN